jgi:hypothetical protein
MRDCNGARILGWGLAATVMLATSLVARAAEPVGEADEAPVPRLVIVEGEHSFGEVTPDVLVEEEFVLRNEGTAPLTLSVLSPGGRVRVIDAPSEIAPGEEGRVRVRADLRRRLGPLEIVFPIATNDPMLARAHLLLTGEVKQFVAATPGFGRWTVVQGEADGTIRQVLQATDEERFQVVAVELPHEGLRAQHYGAEDGWVIDLTLDRWAEVGPITGEVVVRTTHPRQPVVLLPVSGFVRPIMVVTPPSLTGEVELSEPGEQELWVRSYATAPFTITRVEHDLPGVPPAQVLTLEEGRRYSVVLTVGPEVPKGRLESELRIFTDHPHVPSIRVPVDAVIR